MNAPRQSLAPHGRNRPSPRVCTTVDEPAGLSAGIHDLAPSLDELAVAEMLQLWRDHIDNEQRRIVEGNRSYAASDSLDREAAQLVADDPASEP